MQHFKPGFSNDASLPETHFLLTFISVLASTRECLTSNVIHYHRNYMLRKGSTGLIPTEYEARGLHVYEGRHDTYTCPFLFSYTLGVSSCALCSSLSPSDLWRRRNHLSITYLTLVSFMCKVVFFSLLNVFFSCTWISARLAVCYTYHVPTIKAFFS